ncbi:MAG: hypothetical protein WC391_03890 [Methanoregula sp.]|jgi:hypothetical protein
MNDRLSIPELLEQYMETGGNKEQWITVNDLRTFFHLDDTASPAISGFLRRINHGPFFTCQYRVIRIEKMIIDTPHPRMIKRYLIARRPGSAKKEDTGSQ